MAHPRRSLRCLVALLFALFVAVAMGTARCDVAGLAASHQTSGMGGMLAPGSGGQR